MDTALASRAATNSPQSGMVDLTTGDEDDDAWFAEHADVIMAGVEEKAEHPPQALALPADQMPDEMPVKAALGDQHAMDAKPAAVPAGSADTTVDVKPPAPSKPPPKLTPEQKAILRHVMEGKNVYYTGKAGTGKSHLLREIIARAPAGKTFITASTGIAAINIGGTTLHSFAGIGLGEGSVDSLVQKALSGKNTRANWQSVEVLIVDEVSMLHGSLLTKLDAVAKRAKACQQPFGGIQLIFTGDFFQLPPVTRGQRGSDYAFKSDVWSHLFPEGHCFELSTVFRQDEGALVNLLSDVRYARLTPASIQMLDSLRRELQPPNGIEPTLLFGTNEKVDAVNQRRLRDLPEPEISFSADDYGNEPFLGQIRKNCIAEDVLRLRVGAQVMLIKNIDQANGLVNGAKGRVVRFAEEGDEHWPVVLFSNGIEKEIEKEEWSIEQSQNKRTHKMAARRQVPLKLGWAITIHKSQGMGIEWLEVKLDDIFEDGQGYVALSRAIKLEGLRVVAYDPRRFRVSQEVVAFYESRIRGRTREENTDESQWKAVADNWRPDHAKYTQAVRPVGSGGELSGAGGAGMFGGSQYKRPYSDWKSASAMGKKPRGMGFLGATGGFGDEFRRASGEARWLPSAKTTGFLALPLASNPPAPTTTAQPPRYQPGGRSNTSAAPAGPGPTYKPVIAQIDSGWASYPAKGKVPDYNSAVTRR